MEASEPMATYGAQHQELQTLRHSLTDAVYASEDVDTLRSCLIMLTKQSKPYPSLHVEEDEDRVLTREEGEQLVRETFVPAYKDALEAERKGIKYPDISELFKELEKEQA